MVRAWAAVHQLCEESVRALQTPNDWLNVVAFVKRVREKRGYSFDASAEWEGRTAMLAYWAPSKEHAVDIIEREFSTRENWRWPS